ncbi:MAG: 16S rRNA (cytidine(1402)-2'-O)-methyltransferase [Acidimicrobiales bacterium]
MSERGELVLVATPIGNVGDLSPRAVEALSSADVVYCEDTRHSGQLFARLGIRPARLASLHEHNEAERVREVLALLDDGKKVALVTDAGTPTISDPGRRVVAAVHAAGGRVSPIPGPSACVAAMAVSGLGDGRWRFEGFLPRKGRERRARLAEVVAATVPSVIYEAPSRVEALLSELQGLCDEIRPVVVCRELTKLHEEVWSGPLGASPHRWPATTARGEFVIVLDGAEVADRVVPSPTELAEAVAELVVAGSTRRDAVAEVADRVGIARREVYDAVGPKAGGRPAGGL